MKQYIDKSALVAEIKRQILAIDNTPKITDTQISVLSGNKVILTKLLSFIDTLEVKEMDLEKELGEWIKYGPHTNYPWCTIPDAIKITAEHFFELGLKVQKPAFEIEQLKKKVEKLMYDYNQMADIGSTGEVFDEKIMDAKCQVCKDILQYINELTLGFDAASTFKMPQAKERKILYPTEIDI